MGVGYGGSWGSGGGSGVLEPLFCKVPSYERHQTRPLRVEPGIPLLRVSSSEGGERRRYTGNGGPADTT